MRARAWILLLAIPLFMRAGRAEDGTLSVNLGPTGPTSIRWGEAELLAQTPFRISAKGADNKGIALQGDGAPEAGDTGVKRTWPALAVTAAWSTDANVLRLRLTVANISGQSLREVAIDPLTVRFPRRPSGGRWFWGYDLFTTNAGEPGMVEADWGAGKLVLCCEDIEVPCTAGFRGNFGNANTNAIHVATAKGETIPAGDERTWTLSLRFATSDTPATTVAADVFQQFAKAFPFRLQWPDRRPIGAIFMAQSAMKWRTNPRGWFNDAKVDAMTDAGRTAFRERLTKYADTCIGEMKKTGAQGMIFWDVEGGEMPHAITYLGDPRVLPQAAPEMDACADAFFQRFLDAGLKTGICIRPSRVIPGPEGGWKHRQVEDPVSEMADKIAYAKQRWKCTIFYMDTNVTWPLRGPEDMTRGMWQGNATLLPSRSLVELCKRHPDVLIFPEFGLFGYYSCCMPYGELRSGCVGVPDGVRTAWPRAGRTIQSGDGDIYGRWDALLAGAAAGDILLFRGWFGDTANGQIARLHQELALQRAADALPLGGVTAQLAAADATTRYAALLRLDKPNADQAAALLARLGSESEWVVKRRLVVALGTNRIAAAVPALVSLLTDRNAGLDRFAATALGQIGEPATSALVELLADKDARVARMALDALAVSGDAKALLPVLALSRSENKQLREAVAKALGAYSAPEAATRLIELLADPEKSVMLAAIRALGRIRDRTAIEPLVRLIERAVTELKDNNIRAAAGEALEAITNQQHGPFHDRWRKAFAAGEL